MSHFHVAIPPDAEPKLNDYEQLVRREWMSREEAERAFESLPPGIARQALAFLDRCSPDTRAGFRKGPKLSSAMEHERFTASHQDMFEYLIETREAVDGFPLVIHVNDQARVYQPAGWPCQPIEGWGDFRYRTGDTEVAFSVEPPGVQVTIEGSMPRDEADRMVEVISAQLTTHTGYETLVVPIT